MASGRSGISAIVVCFNEEENMGGCLESLVWCDEIVVVDSFSTDRTVEICRRYIDRVIQREWKGYRDQKAYAHSQATQEWVLLVDADERVSPELRDEIAEALNNDGGGHSAFMIPRLVHYLGRWWWRGGWYPDFDIRLFRRDRAVWVGAEPHEKILVDGKVGRLKSPIHHFSYRDITDHLDRINRYTRIAAGELRSSGRRWRLADNLLRPLVRFLRFYLLKGGFREGFAGFFVAATAAFYVFLKYAKLKELEDDSEPGRRGSDKDQEPRRSEGKH